MAKLEAAGLGASYGAAQVLFDVSLEVRPGEIVVLLGRNGAGKSTTLKTLMGLVRASAGVVLLDGRRIERLRPFEIARLGVGYVPEERRIFSGLTVAENLEAGRQPARAGAPHWTAQSLFSLFPALAGMRQRPGGRMSGGEQQMLSIARTLAGNPSLLLLDEPSEGLAPVIVEQVSRTLRAVREAGVGILLCEQNLAFARRVADRAYVLERGRIAHRGTMAELEADPRLREEYLSV
ncbi:MAG TPA: ABC transporter ATP-binding protein [Burkholderiales bacterium]|nr:ABC transporter ATP-binding protein [Burkholderiales bacterium]